MLDFLSRDEREFLAYLDRLPVPTTSTREEAARHRELIDRCQELCLHMMRKAPRDAILRDLAAVDAVGVRNVFAGLFVGHVRRAMGDTDRALSHYLEFIEEHPRVPGVRRAIAEIHARRGELAAATRVLDDELSLHDAGTDRAGLHMLRGFTLLRQGKPLPALADATRALRLDPGLADAYLLRAYVHVQTHNDALAIADFDSGIARDPADLGARLHRGLALHRLGRHASAAADFDAVLEARPDDVPALAGRAAARAEQGDSAGALADLDHALRLRPDTIAMHRKRAQVLYELGREAEAVSVWHDLLERDPTDTEAWLRLAGVAMADDAPDEAVTYLERAIEAESHPVLIRMLVELLLRLDRPLEAVAVAVEGVERHADEALAFEILTHACDVAGDADGAANAAGEALRLEPSGARAIELTRHLIAAGRIDDAAVAVQCAVDLDPRSETYGCRALVRFHQHRFADAIADFDRALADPPSDPEIEAAQRLKRAQARFYALEADAPADSPGESSDLAEIAEDARLAAALDPSNVEARVLLGLAESWRGRLSAAVDALDAAVGLDPTDASLYHCRSQLRADAGDAEGAREDLNRAAALGDLDAIEALRN